MSKYCDSCLTVAYDAVGYDDDDPEGSELNQEKYLAELSGMALLEDHQCDRIETDGEISCKCGDHR